MNPTTPVAVLLTLAGGALAAPPPESPFLGGAPGVSGQIRPRSEINHKSLADTSHTAAYTLLRSRLSWFAAPSPWTEARIELQDARILGSEPHAGKNHASATIGNAKGVDLTQGYGLLRLPVGASDTAEIALGRMKMSLGAGRFLSTLEWSPTARQFDGLAANLGLSGMDFTAFAFQVKDTTNYAAVVANDRYAALLGAYASVPVKSAGLVVELGAFYELGRMDSLVVPGTSEAVGPSDLVTLDARVAGKAGMFTYEQEVLLQVGESWSNGKQTDLEHLAWFSATRVGIAHDLGKVNLGLDALSGDGDAKDSTIDQYRASYWFGHQYFGWMDYFANNPTYGVIDARLDADIPLGKWGAFKPQAHYFLPQIQTDLGESLDAYGQEYDAELHVTKIPKFLLILGAGVFVPGDGAWMLKGAGGLANAKTSSAPGWFLYASPVFSF